MNKFELSAYGVEEMNNQEMLDTNGGNIFKDAANGIKKAAEAVADAAEAVWDWVCDCVGNTIERDKNKCRNAQ